MQCAVQLGYFFPLFYSSQWIKLCLPYVVLGQLLNTQDQQHPSPQFYRILDWEWIDKYGDYRQPLEDLAAQPKKMLLRFGSPYKAGIFTSWIFFHVIHNLAFRCTAATILMPLFVCRALIPFVIWLISIAVAWVVVLIFFRDS
ncbi:hypothetical protein B9Z19DRAFT_616426 [Tuber borchii]|uniref:Uncharacterized protein n=1 Tax=Tuber borchii TaxID=42251 RepID=A0A2T7A0V4_TUBBO|nr:hypothetical protein B9Z19DRAFT_616426 [Tuber borchii]